MTNIDVLGAAMMFGVDTKSKSSLIVAVKANRSPLLMMTKFSEQSSKPDDFLGRLCKAHVFRLIGR